MNSKDTVSTFYSCPFPFPSSIPLAQGCQASVATVGIPIRSVVFSQSQLHVGITWEALQEASSQNCESEAPGCCLDFQAPLSMGFSCKNTGVCCHFLLQVGNELDAVSSEEPGQREGAGNRGREGASRRDPPGD